MGEFGAVAVVSGHIRGLTTTMPLQAQVLYDEYDLVGAFAVASLLMLLALLTLVVKAVGRGARMRGGGDRCRIDGPRRTYEVRTMPGLAGRLAIATGLLVTLAVARDARFSASARCASSPRRKGLPASSSPSPPLARGAAAEHRGPSHGRPDPRRAAAVAAVAARLYSRCAAAVPRSLLRGCRFGRAARSCRADGRVASDGRQTSIGISCSSPLPEQGERFLATGAAPEVAHRGRAGRRHGARRCQRSSRCAGSTRNSPRG